MPSFTMSLREKTIIDRLNQESDRAVAIIGGCILEDRIEASLKARMIIDKKVGGELFGVARPPGSFSAKNDLAFLLRCYGPKLHRELATVNSIRNKFAHYFESKGNEVHDFKSQLIIDLCKNLTLVEGYVLSTTAFNEKYGARESASEVPAGTSWCDNPDTILKDYRERFITTIGIFTAYLGVYPKEDTYIQLVDDEPKPSFEIPAQQHRLRRPRGNGPPTPQLRSWPRYFNLGRASFTARISGFTARDRYLGRVLSSI